MSFLSPIPLVMVLLLLLPIAICPTTTRVGAQLHVNAKSAWYSLWQKMVRQWKVREGNHRFWRTVRQLRTLSCRSAHRNAGRGTETRYWKPACLLSCEHDRHTTPDEQWRFPQPLLVIYFCQLPILNRFVTLEKKWLNGNKFDLDKHKLKTAHEQEIQQTLKLNRNHLKKWVLVKKTWTDINNTQKNSFCWKMTQKTKNDPRDSEWLAFHASFSFTCWYQLSLNL